ncbi:MAG: hypothetical protein IJB53_00245 [Mailhella sp.]|nr:hypothetical protein [Mailhella sp.]
MDIDLDTLLRLANEAKSGNWTLVPSDGWNGRQDILRNDDYYVGEISALFPHNRAMANYITASCNALPSLIHTLKNFIEGSVQVKCQELERELSAKDALLRHLAKQIITRSEYFGKCYTVDDVLKLAKETMDVS